MKDGALLKCVKNADITLEFMGLCKWLTDEIQVFTGIIENITGIHASTKAHKSLGECHYYFI